MCSVFRYLNQCCMRIGIGSVGRDHVAVPPSAGHPFSLSSRYRLARLDTYVPIEAPRYFGGKYSSTRDSVASHARPGKCEELVSIRTTISLLLYVVAFISSPYPTRDAPHRYGRTKMEAKLKELFGEGMRETGTQVSTNVFKSTVHRAGFRRVVPAPFFYPFCFHLRFFQCHKLQILYCCIFVRWTYSLVDPTATSLLERSSG